MALDPEELKKRRQERQQRQAARQKQFRLRIAIAAVVLIACGILIAVVVSGGQDKAPEETTLSPDTTVPAETLEDGGEATDAEEEKTTEGPSETTITLAFAGDLNITDRVIASGGSNYDYSKVFLDVAHILADADLTALNLEGNLCGTPYGSQTASAPQELAVALRNAGVDLVQLANSYAISRGISGLGTTIDSIRDAGMEPLGVYKNQNDFRTRKGYTLVDVQGIRIAFVAFTKGMDGMALPAGSGDCVNLLYTDYESTYRTVDTEGITQILESVAKEKPDLTVAMLHWGSEYNDTVSSSQERIVSLLQENGVDAIVGTHSHFVQQMEFDPEKGTFVAYSLGDFLSDGEKSGSQYSVILELEVTRNHRTGNTKLTGYHYTPIYSAQIGESLRVLRLEEAIAAYEDSFIGSVSASIYEDMKYAMTRVHERIAGE